MNISTIKLINGIKYILKNSKNVGITKLFKSLYYWDFLHFNRFGTSVTGLIYYTYNKGPVPKKLYHEISSSQGEISKHFKFLKEENEENEYQKYNIYIKNKKIDLDWFSPNELKVLEEVVTIFKNSSAVEMSNITHLKNTPWEKTKREKGLGVEIDYMLAVDDNSTLDYDTIKERYKIQMDLIADGRL